MAATSQAIELGRALRALGLTQRGRDKDFAVRTRGNGRVGFGDAVAVPYTTAANDRIAANAERLAEQGFTVAIYTTNDGVVASVTTAYNPNREVFRHRVGGVVV